MALICPNVVAHLKIPTHKLTTPERVNVALGSSNELEQLTDYAIIEPASTDGIFQSKHIHTVIAPGLCMPMILGLPFLTTNKVICNYAERTCLATCVSPPYDLMTIRPKQKETTTTVTPDLLALIRERVKTLSFEEELAANDAEM